jgi:hypothetical protein
LHRTGEAAIFYFLREHFNIHDLDFKMWCDETSFPLVASSYGVQYGTGRAARAILYGHLSWCMFRCDEIGLPTSFTARKLDTKHRRVTHLSATQVSRCSACRVGKSTRFGRKGQAVRFFSSWLRSGASAMLW